MATPWPTQQLGSTGEDVRTVQYLVAVHGHPVAVDGQFGPVTRAAVKAFQASKGLGADGVVGNLTWSALIVPVAPGAGGDRLRAVQGQLASQGWRLAVDGVAGPQTARSIRDFQSAHGLVVDGAVGPQTWNVMVAGFARLPSPDLAATRLYDAWGSDDRVSALRSATQAAVDLLLRGTRGTLTAAGCVPDPVLGPGHFVCAYTYEGGAASLQVRGTVLDGYYVESASFVAD
ncbi:MAG TPA: peptidoglycan-binding protein [Candidatus Lustribacter sp.]|nr:peptidoglycan-binding protein [Candidatus Lustribacter sp.]